MWRTIVIAAILVLLPVMGYSADYTQQQVWIDAETITHTKLNVDIQGIINVLNDLDNDNIASAAAIAYGKLNLTGSIVNADIASSAAIANSKLAKPYYVVTLTYDEVSESVDPIATFQMFTESTLEEVSACARRVDTGGSETYEIDVEEAGTTVLSSALSITTANTPVVATISDADIADDAKIEVTITLGGSAPTLGDLTILLVFTAD